MTTINADRVYSKPFNTRLDERAFDGRVYGYDGQNDLIFDKVSLDLRFAANKTLTDQVSKQNLITFTRASSGTYVDSDGLIKTATTNTPRFDHNPTTGESLGLLVEEQRTNLLLRSEEFDNASWTKTNSSVTANSITAPDGTTSADYLAENTSLSEHFAEQGFTAVAGVAYTFSVYVKAGPNKTAVVLRYTTTAWGGGISNQVRLNLINGAITVVSGTATGAATQLNDGWWRFSITATSTANGSPAVRVQLPENNGTNTNYTGDGTSGIYLWGAQLEAGAFPTSYILTTSATVTRAADVASITGTNFSSWYNQTEGTVFVERIQAPTDAANARRFLNISDGTNSNAIQLYQAGPGQFAVVSYVSGVSNFAPTPTGTPATGAVTKGSFAFSSTGKSAGRDGGSISTSAVSPPVSGLNTLFIGGQNASSIMPCSPIRRITYWPTRLSNTTLQAITT